MIPIFDGHNDTVHRLREYRPDGIDFLERSAGGHLDLPRAIDGGLAGGMFAMFAPAEFKPKDEPTITAAGYEVRMALPLDPEYARQTIAAQLAALTGLAARSEGKIRIAASAADIENARAGGRFAMVLHMEGAEAIDRDLRDIGTWYAAGLRSLGPVWSRPNAFGHGVPFAWPSSPDTGPGLTDAGKELVRACNRLGIMIDLSHLNERGFWDVAALSSAPLVATHACVHAICGSARNLTDRQLDAIRESDGLVGVNLAVNDLRPDGRRDVDTPLDLVVRHFAHLADRLGIDRVAIGSDFDGASIPVAIGDAGGLPNLLAALQVHGFDEASVRKIAFENWMRVLSLSWRA